MKKSLLIVFLGSLIGVSLWATQRARSDTKGIYHDQNSFESVVPEPATVLIGIGLIAFGLASKWVRESGKRRFVQRASKQ